MTIRLKALVAGCALSLLGASAFAQTLAPLNSDTETDRIEWSQLDAKFGAVPAAPAGTRIGGVSKTLTNEYWRSLGEGYEAYAKKAGVEVVYQAAQSEATSSASSRSPRTSSARASPRSSCRRRPTTTSSPRWKAPRRRGSRSSTSTTP